MIMLESSMSLTLLVVLRRRAQQGPAPPLNKPRVSRTDRTAHRVFTKRMLEDQMRQKMVSLWQEVLEAEKALDDGDVDALGAFISAAGTMIDNHRMAKHMFTRHRVCPLFPCLVPCHPHATFVLSTIQLISPSMAFLKSYHRQVGESLCLVVTGRL